MHDILLTKLFIRTNTKSSEVSENRKIYVDFER